MKNFMRVFFSLFLIISSSSCIYGMRRSPIAAEFFSKRITVDLLKKYIALPDVSDIIKGLPEEKYDRLIFEINAWGEFVRNNVSFDEEADQVHNYKMHMELSIKNKKASIKLDKALEGLIMWIVAQDIMLEVAPSCRSSYTPFTMTPCSSYPSSPRFEEDFCYSPRKEEGNF